MIFPAMNNAPTALIRETFPVGPLQCNCNSSASAAGVTARVYERLNQVRSRLEDWAFMEHPGGITREVDAKLYYGAAVEGYTN